MRDITEVTLSFRAMNTDVGLIVCAPVHKSDRAKRALHKIKDLFLEVERTLSRFDPASELSRLNRSAGSAFKASGTLFEAVKMSLDAAYETNGIFDPTVLPDLVAAGYDRSFERLSASRETLPDPPDSTRRSAWRDIYLDPASLIIHLPAGVCLDLGGIGKGWTVDRASRYLQNCSGYAVDAGGDIRVAGSQADGSPWTVGVDDPFGGDRCLMVLRLNGGAVCTSTISRRRWQTGSMRRHHIIDPRTGKPSASGVVSATVIADTAAMAEVIAKTALILGPEAGLRFINSQPGARGLLVLEDGRPVCSDRQDEINVGI